MQKVISIIIPTYNMEAYIAHTLQSLLITHLDDIEVLVINDGSKDCSSAIAHQIAAQHPESIKVIDKENGNYGSCINAGLSQATGKYVKILDADDRFDTHNFDFMVGKLKEIDADLIITHFTFTNANGEMGSIRHIHLPTEKVLNIDNIAHTKSIRGLWMHEITYRRENLLKMGYHQCEGIAYTDVQWGFDPMSTIRTVYYMNLLIYHYLVGREGQTIDKTCYRNKFGQEFQCTSAMLNTYVTVHMTSKATERMMRSKMEGRIIALYKRAMVELDDMEHPDMIAFDEELRQKSPSLYHSIDKKLLSIPLFCYPYIHVWRKNHRDKWLHMIIRLYRKHKNISINL